jgi:RimJ/RimL family protein N-acetyltransferase
MSDLLLLPITEEDLSELEQWHADSRVKDRYGGADWPRKLFQFTKRDSNRTYWIAWENEKRIGYVDCEVKDATAWIGLVVNPAMHNQGHGKNILRSFLRLPFVQPLKEVRAGIEEDNEPSLRCFQGARFTRLDEKPDHEGIINFSYNL